MVTKLYGDYMILTQHPLYLDYMKRLANEFEGRIPWMYLDGPGNVTAGVGHLIASSELAAGLGFIGGMPDEDWDRISRARPGLPAYEYCHLTASRLPDEAIDTLLRADLEAKQREIAMAFPLADGFPATARIALLDMAFNLGAHGLAEYPRMLDAMSAGEWVAAAGESRRRGISSVRNEWTRQMIQQAGEAR